MNVWCAYCEKKGTKADMLVSRHTGKAYCRDEIACDKRKRKRKLTKGGTTVATQEPDDGEGGREYSGKRLAELTMKGEDDEAF